MSSDCLLAMGVVLVGGTGGERLAGTGFGTGRGRDESGNRRETKVRPGELLNR